MIFMRFWPSSRQVTAFQDEAPIEEDTLRDIAYMFVDMINLSTTLPSPADIAAAVLAPGTTPP